MKHKVHRESAMGAPLCKQRSRLLIPPAVAIDWQEVTCARCLGHRPAPVESWLSRALASMMRVFRGER